MARSKSYILGGATLVCALGIGYVMQYGLALPGSQKTSATQPVEVTDITLTTSGLGTPMPPMDRSALAANEPAVMAPLSQPGVSQRGVTVNRGIADPTTAETTETAEGVEPEGLTEEQVEMAAATAPEDTARTISVEATAAVEPQFACDMMMDAFPTAGAMVRLSLDAACHASERVTIHHQGMMFTEVMSADGTLDITVPALAENALFIAAFLNGEGATANAEVTSLPFYDRVAVQWKGQSGLQLHAREFGADYFTPGHIWSGSAGDIANAAAGESGFLVRLGQNDAPDALIAEVYSFPAGTSKKDGDVLMTIEAEVTADNCNRQIEAQTLDLREGNALRVGDLTLEIPACDSLGDFLVLKNIVQDMKVATR